ncbi:MAG: ClpP-like prohead protease/major capsid protein fusion protein [Candidatus Competibacteraceae bacterium]
MTKPYYQITARGPAAADLNLYGPIGDSLFTESVTARALVAELAAMSGKALTVYLNSPGGSVMDATAIYNALQRHSAPVKMVVDGWALSAASLIAMAGQSLTMGQASLLMLHNPSMIGAGKAEDLRRAATTLDAVRAQMLTIYAGKTGADEATVTGWLDAETWFDADAAIAAKLADGKITQSATPAPAPEATLIHFPAAYATYLNPHPESLPMNLPAETSAQTLPVADAPDLAAITASIRDSERQRQIDIRIAASLSAKLAPSQAATLTALQDTLISAGASADEARKQLMDVLGKTSEPLANGQGIAMTPSGSPHTVTVTSDASDQFRAGATEGLLIRAGAVPNNRANEFRSLRMSVLAEQCLVRAQLNPRNYNGEMALIKAAITHTASDFPVILENVLNKTLLDAYAVAAETWRQWCAVGSVADFRPYKRLRLGSFGNLDSLTEAGEYKHKAIPDATAESVSIGTKANTITLSRQAIINDDLGAFVRLGQMLARAAARSIEADAYALLVSNPALDSDSTALFHANHGNLHTGSSTNPAAAITMTSLDAARSAIKIQKDRSGTDYIGITEPFILLCPVAKAGAARTANESEFDPDTANKLNRTNITRGIFKAIVDTPYLTGTGWYLLADPMQYPTFEVLFLNGQQTPYTEQTTKTDVDGVAWLIRHDYGVNVVDYVGAYYNTGA